MKKSLMKGLGVRQEIAVGVKYGEKEIQKVSLERWENKQKDPFEVQITLPEFTCKCPRSGYPDFATFQLNYVPDKWVIELKTIKLYINSFRDRYLSHENSTNEIFDTLWKSLNPRYMELIGDFNPRGNVHTIVRRKKIKRGFRGKLQ